jgi:hypothetical protein
MRQPLLGHQKVSPLLHLLQTALPSVGIRRLKAALQIICDTPTDPASRRFAEWDFSDSALSRSATIQASPFPPTATA